MTHNVSIQGEELEVVLAKSLIDDLLQKYEKSLIDGGDKIVDNLVKNLQAVNLEDNVKVFALKLGYNEDHINIAANNCIKKDIKLNCDNLLLELTKQCPQKSINDKNTTEYFQEEFVTKTVAEYTSAQSTIDNGDLRGIVIDGSNVAMW